MHIKELINELKIAHENLNVERHLEEGIIEEEIEVLEKFVDLLFPFATKKTINGKEALLLYVYGIDEKSFISHEVYLDKELNVIYQIFDLNKYLGFVPDADVRNGYRYMKLNDFLKNKPLKDIFEFFIERIDVLQEYTDDTRNLTEDRKLFLRKIKEAFK